MALYGDPQSQMRSGYPSRTAYGRQPDQQPTGQHPALQGAQSSAYPSFSAYGRGQPATPFQHPVGGPSGVSGMGTLPMGPNMVGPYGPGTNTFAGGYNPQVNAIAAMLRGIQSMPQGPLGAVSQAQWNGMQTMPQGPTGGVQTMPQGPLGAAAQAAQAQWGAGSVNPQVAQALLALLGNGGIQTQIQGNQPGNPVAGQYYY